MPSSNIQTAGFHASFLIITSVCVGWNFWMIFFFFYGWKCFVKLCCLTFLLSFTLKKCFSVRLLFNLRTGRISKVSWKLNLLQWDKIPCYCNYKEQVQREKIKKEKKKKSSLSSYGVGRKNDQHCSAGLLLSLFKTKLSKTFNYWNFKTMSSDTSKNTERASDLLNDWVRTTQTQKFFDSYILPRKPPSVWIFI